MARHHLMTARLASDAVAVTCQQGSPKRSSSKRPTTAASGEGIMVVKPFAPSRVSASTTAGGEWPNMAPVSPRQKSM